MLISHEGPVWLSIDATSIPRPEAETSLERGMIYVCNLPHATQPVSVGWQFSTVMLLPERRSSWGAILSQQRIANLQTAVAVAIEQLEHQRALLPEKVRMLADRWYMTGAFLAAYKRIRVEVLLRLKCNHKLYRPAPGPQLRQRGAPAKTERCFRAIVLKPGGEPEQEWQGTDERCHPVTVQAWHHLHLRQACEVEVSVYRVARERARGTKRDPVES